VTVRRKHVTAQDGTTVCRHSRCAVVYWLNVIFLLILWVS